MLLHLAEHFSFSGYDLARGDFRRGIVAFISSSFASTCFSFAKMLRRMMSRSVKKSSGDSSSSGRFFLFSHNSTSIVRRMRLGEMPFGSILKFFLSIQIPLSSYLEQVCSIEKRFRLFEIPMMLIQIPLRLIENGLMLIAKPVRLHEKPMRLTQILMRLNENGMTSIENRVYSIEKPVRLIEKPIGLIQIPSRLIENRVTSIEKPCIMIEKWER